MQSAKGVTLVGALPPAVQSYIVFAASIHTRGSPRARTGLHKTLSDPTARGSGMPAGWNHDQRAASVIDGRIAGPVGKIGMQTLEQLHLGAVVPGQRFRTLNRTITETDLVCSPAYRHAGGDFHRPHIRGRGGAIKGEFVPAA